MVHAIDIGQAVYNMFGQRRGAIEEAQITRAIGELADRNAQRLFIAKRQRAKPHRRAVGGFYKDVVCHLLHPLSL